MPRKIGIVASQAITGVVAPTLSIVAATNYNQSVATLNATVLTWGGASTSVVFQYSTASNFSSFSSATAVGSPFTANTATMYVNVSGLTENTTYYVRAVATNTAGSTTTTSVSFATWHLIEFVATPSASGGTYPAVTSSTTIPTVTPTGGSAVTPSIYELIMFGSGSQSTSAASPIAAVSSNGGAGYRTRTSYSFTNGTNTTLNYTLGGALFPTDPTTAILGRADGQDTTISNGVPTLTAGGGIYSDGVRYPNPHSAGNPGPSTQMVTSTPSQTDGAAKTHGIYHEGYSTLLYSSGHGASGGAGANGSTPVVQAGAHQPPGQGVTYYGYSGGAGSMGFGFTPNYNNTVPEAIYRDYGAGVAIHFRADGQVNANGIPGPYRSNARSLLRFRYYGP